MPIKYDDDDAGTSGFSGFADDDEAALLGDNNGVKPGSLLASVARKAAEFVAKPTRLEIPSVPGLFAEFATTLETRQLNKLRQTADRFADKGARQFRWNLLVLAHYNTGLFLNGERLEDDNGSPTTFRSRELWDQFEDVGDSAGAVYAMYGRQDFVITAAVNGLLSDAGIDTELARQDPS